MSSQHPNAIEPELQFETAESTVACANCKRPIRDQYYELAGQLLCAGCTERVGAAVAAASSGASFGRAALFGVGAAAAGAVGYAAFIRVSGWDLSLVSVLVGFLVGRAVRTGARGFGGRRYQLLAAALTYFAVGLTYVLPDMMRGGADRPGFGIAFAVALIFPVLVLHDPLGFIIRGVAVYQAWRVTKGPKLAVTGPYAVGTGPAARPTTS